MVYLSENIILALFIAILPCIGFLLFILLQFLVLRASVFNFLWDKDTFIIVDKHTDSFVFVSKRGTFDCNLSDIKELIYIKDRNSKSGFPGFCILKTEEKNLVITNLICEQYIFGYLTRHLNNRVEVIPYPTLRKVLALSADFSFMNDED